MLINDKERFILYLNVTMAKWYVLSKEKFKTDKKILLWN